MISRHNIAQIQVPQSMERTENYTFENKHFKKDIWKGEKDLIDQYLLANDKCCSDIKQIVFRSRTISPFLNGNVDSSTSVPAEYYIMQLYF